MPHGSHVQIHVLIPESGTELAHNVQDRLVLHEDRIRKSHLLVIHEGQAELDLIREHPDLFAAFYNIQPTYIQIPLLYELGSSLRLLIYLYPRTIWLLAKATGIKPVEMWRRLKEFHGQEVQDFILTDLQQLYTHFEPFAMALLEEINEPERSLIQDILAFEVAGAAFRAQLSHEEEESTDVLANNVYYLSGRTKIQRSKTSISRVISGIREGKPLVELAKEQHPEWVVFLGIGRRTRTIIGFSTLKAFLIEHLYDHPRTASSLKERAAQRWPSIDKEQLNGQIDLALEQLAEAAVIRYQQRPSELSSVSAGG